MYLNQREHFRHLRAHSYSKGKTCLNLKFVSLNKTPTPLPASCNCHFAGQGFRQEIFLPGNRRSSVSASAHLRAATLSLLQFGCDVSAASVRLQQPKASRKRYPSPSIRRKDVTPNTYTSTPLPVVFRRPAPRLSDAGLASRRADTYWRLFCFASA